MDEKMNRAIMKNGYVKYLLATVAFAGLATFLPLSASAEEPMQVAAANTSTSTKAPSSDNLRLMLDQVDLDLDTGKYDAAATLIKKLKAKYPNNPDVLAAEADLNDHLSQKSNAAEVSDVCMPNSLESNNTDLLQHDRSGMKENFLCGGYNRRITPQAVEQIENLGGQVALPYAGGVTINADFENDHLNTAEQFDLARGRTISFYGDRQQGTVMASKAFGSSQQGALMLYGIGNNAGGGAQYAWYDRWGGTSVQGNFNKPDWDYVESTVEYGTKDNVIIERKQVFTPDLQAVLNGQYNHYSIQYDEDAADGPGLNFNLDYDHPFSFSEQGPNSPSWMNDEVTLGAHYAVEAEYLTYVNHEFNGADLYHPLPMTSYEVHTFTASAEKTILPNLDGQLSGGYGVDRISGTSGPIYGGSLTYTPWQRLGIDIHGSRDMVGGQNLSEKEDVVGTSLKWTW
jgi:hypothetical protein